ncbi:hypothetical protein WMY93_001456 [Mugilogobius chulae]|uniref:Uncharacterized protein n=1 Tax=Mugilogobius chulae TaxID=88201 RepID=A0AAW0Q3A0_9GOBI
MSPKNVKLSSASTDALLTSAIASPSPPTQLCAQLTQLTYWNVENTGDAEHPWLSACDSSGERCQLPRVCALICAYSRAEKLPLHRATQTGPFILTWTMSNDSPVLTNNSTDLPVSAGQDDSYVLLLIVLSVFAAGTLVLLSLLLLFCHRCCMRGRRYSRASDDPEKTNTTYAEDSQPTQDALSASGCHDGDSERFVSTSIIGRRVSFNESALTNRKRLLRTRTKVYSHRRRLPSLEKSPSDSSAPASSIIIYQISERRVFRDPLDWVGGLPGDPHHSVITDQRRQSSLVRRPLTHSQTIETFGNRAEAESKSSLEGDSNQALGQKSVLRFFSKLRRHASLEGVGPYFRRWKFDSSHRAASLDDKGSPKGAPSSDKELQVKQQITLKRTLLSEMIQLSLFHSHLWTALDFSLYLLSVCPIQPQHLHRQSSSG